MLFCPKNMDLLFFVDYLKVCFIFVGTEQEGTQRKRKPGSRPGTTICTDPSHGRKIPKNQPGLCYDDGTK